MVLTGGMQDRRRHSEVGASLAPPRRMRLSARSTAHARDAAMQRLRRSCRRWQADAGGPFEYLRLCRLDCFGPRHLKQEPAVSTRAVFAGGPSRLAGRPAPACIPSVWPSLFVCSKIFLLKLQFTGSSRIFMIILLNWNDLFKIKSSS